MKKLLRMVAPSFLVDGYRRLRRFLEDRQNLQKNTEDVFTEIYQRNKWGGLRGQFYSGSGSDNKQVVAPYVAVISELATREKFRGLTFVDLGCGDFRVGSQLRPLASRYIGVDIVESLVGHNQATYADAATKFVHLNIVTDELPDGDVSFVRQVFQHLGNHQIANVIQKLRKYRWVFITEHYPTHNARIRPNLDKVQGERIRLYENSGVYLSEPPFSLPPEECEQVLEVAGLELEGWNDRGIIRTFLYKPRAQWCEPK